MRKIEFYQTIGDEYFKSVVMNSLSRAEVVRSLGLPITGQNYRLVYSRIESLGLDTSHMTGSAWNQGERFRPFNTNKHEFDEIFCKNSPVKLGTNHRKIKLFNLGIKDYKCEICRISEWNNKPLTLQMHHINGDRTDNRLENLQILCPNCHSQTDNYCGRNAKSKSESETTSESLVIPCPYCGRKVHEDSPHIEKCKIKRLERDLETSERSKDYELKTENGISG